MSALDEILAVDLLAFEQGDRGRRQAVVAGVMDSLATGFVYAHHDIPEGVIDEAYSALTTFFRAPQAEKDRYVVPGSMGQTGYTGLLVEAAASADKADFKEMLNWGIELPMGHPLRRAFPHRYMERALPESVVPGITQALGELYDRLLDLQRRFLRIIAVGLGLQRAFFDDLLVDGPTLCRAIRYPPMDQAPGDDYVWADAHGDINLITALPRATSKGLQVQVGDQWIAAAPPDGYAIINTGLMLERLSNGRVPAGIHRVVADPESVGERYSVVQFCHPTPRTILAPVSSCITAENPQRHAPIQAGDWLDQVLYDINLVEDARRLDGDASRP